MPHSTPESCSSSERPGAPSILAECRSRIEDARSETCAGLDRSTRALTATVDRALQFARTMDATADTTEAGVQSALARLDADLDATEVRVTELGASRLAAVGDAVSANRELRMAAEEMARAAASSRLVALNALISAGQLGRRGAPLSVIATEMGDLANEVRKLSRDVEHACGSLEALLPTLSKGASALEAHTQSLSEDVDPLRERMARHADELGASVRETRQHAEQSVADLADKAREGREALDVGADFEAGLERLIALVTAFGQECGVERDPSAERGVDAPSPAASEGAMALDAA